MVSRKGQVTLNFNSELRRIIKDNFGTDDVIQIKEIILKYLENPDSTSLSFKDQILLERLTILREQRPLQLRKLTAQVEILEARNNFQNNFKTPLSNHGSQILQKSINTKYQYGKPEPISENIQLKKNFFIDKHTDGSYVGVCKVCQNFTTDVCTTSHEAEGDIELHLESIHHKELYQR